MYVLPITERELVILLYKNGDHEETFCDVRCLNQYLLREYGTENPSEELGLTAYEELVWDNCSECCR